MSPRSIVQPITRLEDLSERDRFALQYVYDQHHPNHWIEASTIAAHEYRQALAAGETKEIDRLGRTSTSLGWGRTLSRLTTVHGLVYRQFSNGSWAYQISDSGRHLIERGVIEDAARNRVGPRPSLVRDRGEDGRFACGVASRGAGAAREEHRRSTDAAGPEASGQ